uniref:Uncharacterized protein n=1 Tax=Marseillevirus sp. TaxID=2809551 RepID=A0AA96EJS7_9VIRU|nr:hypothetical protein MarFTMF_049 [Marseillevirus sp.]
MKVSLREAKLLAKKLGIDLEQVPIEVWQYAIQTETEHLRSLGCDLTKCALVSRDHLREFSTDYYIELWKMEEKLEKRFKGKKPRVLVPGTKLPPACRR